MANQFSFHPLPLVAYLIRSFSSFFMYNIETFSNNGWQQDLKEVFYTVSKKM